MGRKTATFFTILIASLAIAHQIGIPLPSPSTGLNRTTLSIFLVQSLICYFSRLPATAIVEHPEKLKGDVDGSLTAELLEERIYNIQAVICSTVSIVSGGLVIAKICCPDGLWNSPPDSAIPLIMLSGMGEFFFAMGCGACSYIGHKKRWEDARTADSPFPKCVVQISATMDQRRNGRRRPEKQQLIASICNRSRHVIDSATKPSSLLDCLTRMIMIRRFCVSRGSPRLLISIVGASSAFQSSGQFTVILRADTSSRG